MILDFLDCDAFVRVLFEQLENEIVRKLHVRIGRSLNRWEFGLTEMMLLRRAQLRRRRVVSLPVKVP